MAEYKIYFKRSAVKDLKKISKGLLKKIRVHRIVKSFPVRSVVGFGREIIALLILFRTINSLSRLLKPVTDSIQDNQFIIQVVKARHRSDA
jgi:hypothetical protein